MSTEHTLDADKIIEGVCKTMHPKLEAIVHQYCDEAYAAIMESVQDYLVDNAQYNIGQRTLSAEAENKRLNLRNYELSQEHKAMLEALTDLNCSEILGVAESCASGMPRWEFVHQRIERARAAIAKATPEQKIAERKVRG